MLKNKSKWFYAFIVAMVLLVAAAVVIAVIGGNRETPQGDANIPEGAETGVYYYSVEQGEIILSLNSGNKFTIAGPGMNRTGTYTVTDNNVAFTFVQGSDVATAVLGKDVVTMTYNGNVMTFLKQVNYTVSFANAGGDTFGTATVCNGKTVAMPATPVKEGHVFIGWYADAACQTAYDFTGAITGDVTVYAGWVEKQVGFVEYTANFDLGYEGAERMEAMQTINGQLYNVPTPVRSGYTFGGWFISMYEDGQKLTAAYTADTVLTADTTLFAVWHDAAETKLANPNVTVTATGLKWNAVDGASAYQVKIVAADGIVVHEGSLGATSMNFDFAALSAGDYTVEVVAVASNSANNSEATVRYFRNKALNRVSNFQVINGMLIFGAVENAENYRITVDCGNPDHNHNNLDNGNATVFNFSNCYMQEGGIRFTVVATAKGYADSVAQTYVYERSLTAVENLTYDKAGDQFIWDAVENAAGSLVTVTVGENTYTVNNGNANSFSIAAYSGDITVAVVPVTNGYNSPAAATANCSKTAPAAPQNVQVNGMVITWDEVAGATKYEVKIGSSTYEVTTNSVDLVEKKFDASVGQTYTVLVKAIAGAEGSSYSKAVDVQYKTLDTVLTYKANKVFWTPVLGGENFEIRVNGGDVITVSGVNFAQIVLDKAGTNLIEVRCTDVSGDWASIEVTAYEVTYYSRTLGGEAREYLAIGDTMLLPEHFTNEGYDFDGWYNTPGAANGNGMEYNGNVFTGNGNMALYANWSPKDYDIQFIVDGTITNITNESTQSVTYTKHFQLTVPTTSDNGLGYFVGWYNGPSGTGVQITDSEGNSLVPYDVIGTTVVYPYFADALAYELLSDGTYGVKQGLGIKNKSVTEIIIPATYKDIPVTQIIDNAFLRCYDIVSVQMPDTITRVGIGAFERCDSLENIDVYVVDPNSTAFKPYSSSDGALLFFDEASGNTNLEVFPRAKTGTYTVPEEVDNIRPYAFKYSKISKVIISKGVTYVAESAFYECKSLHTIEFEFGRETSVTIANDAFNNLPKVETLILPAKLNVIEDLKTLDKLTALKTIQVEEGGENYSASNNLLCDGPGTALLYVPNSFAGVFEAPMGITGIADGVFAGKASITEVIIPAWVTSIGNNAFENCANLLKVTVRGPRNNELVIGEAAFAACEHLLEVVFEGGNGSGSGTITIGNNAFMGNGEMESFVVGQNVIIASIGEHAFSKNQVLSDLDIHETAVINAIGAYAFENCISIKEYVVHASTTSIGDYAFIGCAYLETVEFAPNGGQIDFGVGVFQDCVRLTTIVLPATLSAFDGSVFDGCEHISNVEVENGNPYLETHNGALYTKGLTELIYYPRNLTGDLSQLPWDTLTKIGPAVFKGNVKVTNVVIGDKITEIGAGAFANCINLNSLTFANMDGAMIIGDNAFDNCTKLTAIAVPAQTTSIGASAFYMTKISEFTIPETVTFIGDYAFAYTDITTITIPSAVTYVGQGAFYKAAKLANVTFVGGTEPLVIGTVDLEATSIHLRNDSSDDPKFDTRGTFVGTALTQIDLPANISVIGDFAFDGMTTLTVVNIPAEAQLKTIGMNAFNKTGITSISLGEGLEFIGEHAFALTKLTTITIPGTVQHLRAYALSTTTLTEILFAANTAEDANLTIYNFAMLGVSTAEITLPAHVSLIGEYNTEYAYHTVCDVFYENTTYAAYDGIKSTTTLAKLHVAEGGKYYGSKDGILYAKGPEGELLELQFCPKLNTGDIIVPNTVVHVQHSAFIDTQLSTIVFEEFPKDDPRYGQPLLEIGSCAELKNTCPVVIGTTAGTVYTKLTYISFPSHLSVMASQAIYGLRVDTKANPNWTLELVFNSDSIVEFRAASVRSNSAISKLSLPKVSMIGRYAFYGCGAKEITFTPGSTVSEIGEFALSQMSNVTSLEIPASVRMIGKQGISSCNALVNFTQEEGGCLETLGEQAFYGCGSIVSFKIPDTVTIIGDAVFESCRNLETLEISANMQSPEAASASIVKGCTKFREVIVPENHAYLKSVDGVLYDIQETILFLYPQAKGQMTTAIPETVHTIATGAFYGYQGTSIQLPANLRYIRANAFGYARQLTSIEIPASVVEIGFRAFDSTTALRTVVIPENSKLETIGEYAFYDCAMDSIYLPDSVSSIGQQAFHTCRNLTSVVLPAALKNLGNMVFRYCNNLQSITMQEGLEEIGNSVFNYDAKLVSVNIPDSVTKMGSSLFSNCTGLEEVLMSENSQLKSIGNLCFYACASLKRVEFGPLVEAFGTENINSKGEDLRRIFEGCTALEEVKMPDALTDIPMYLFKGCTSLKAVNLPASCSTIGPEAFVGCTGITELTLTASLTSIGTRAFADCTGLITVHVESGCGLQRIADGAFENTTALTGIALPSSVTHIGNAAFRNSAIAEAPIPASLTKIGDYAFYGCKNLTSIGIPSTVTGIGAYAFAGCENVESLALSVGLKTIGDFAFADCYKLTEAIIPKTVAFMGANPFTNCTGMTSVTLESGNESFKDIDGVILDKTGYTLIAYPVYKTDATYEIPESVYEIAGGAFAGSQLQSIVLPDNVRKISESAFRNSRKLETVVIPGNVSSIEARAFQDCVMLNNVVIPAAVASLGDYAFAGCTSLTNLILEERKTEMTVGAHLFDGCTSLTTVFEFPGVNTFSAYMYANTGIVNLVIPDSYTNLNTEGVFAYCANLQTVQFPANPGTRLGGRFFKGCTALVSIDIPSTITSIGTPYDNTTSTEAIGEVFMDCTSLQSISFNATGFSGESTFENCVNLTTVVAGQQFGAVSRMFANCGKLTASALSKVNDLNKETLLNCVGLTGEVDFSSIRTFGQDCLAGCVNLSKVTVGHREMQLNTYSFRGLTANTTIYFKSFSSLEQIAERFGSSVLKIPNNTEAKLTFYTPSGSQTVTLTNEEIQMIEKLGEYGLDKGMMEAAQQKLLAYKTAFNDMNPSKEISKEEMEQMQMFLKEMGMKADEKVLGILYEQWAAYKQTLAKALLEQYALTDEENQMIEKLAEYGLDKSMLETAGQRLMMYKASFNDMNPGKELSKEEMEQLQIFIKEMGMKVDEKVLSVLYEQWAAYKQSLAKALMEKFALTDKEQQMVQKFAELIHTKDLETIQNKLMAYKASFTDTEPSKEITKEEQEQLRMFLESMGLKVDEKVMMTICEQWLTYKNELVAANKPVTQKTYLTEKEIAELEELVGKIEISPEALEAIKAAWSEWKFNFTETKFDEGMVKQWGEELRSWLIKELGVDEKSGGLFVDMAVERWGKYATELAEKNAKAQLTDEEQKLIMGLMDMGAGKEMLETVQQKLFNYKRFVSLDNPEVTAEEQEMLQAFLEELGIPADKFMDQALKSFMEYKQMLIKTMSK